MRAAFRVENCRRDCVSLRDGRGNMNHEHMRITKSMLFFLFIQVILLLSLLPATEDSRASKESTISYSTDFFRSYHL